MLRFLANISTRAIILIPTCSFGLQAKCACPIFFYGSSLTRRCMSRPNCGRISQRKTFLPRWKNLDAGNAATEWWSNLQALRCTQRDFEVTKHVSGAAPAGGGYRKASVTESASDLPARVNMKQPFD